MLYDNIKKCRICGNDKMKTVFNLGKQPPANSLRSRLREKLPEIPLAICRCGRCTTVQLTDTVRPDYLFRHYVWVTGTSAMVKDYRMIFYRKSIEYFKKTRLFVIEVASNDGTFLEPYKDNGHRVLGIDPAKNIARIANNRGIPTIAEFFGKKIAGKIVSKYGKADFVFARNVLPHVADIDDVILGMRDCLDAGGIGAAEFHYAKVILNDLHYDSIYHEHLCYFSVKSFSYLLKKHGLHVFDAMESPINGGNLVLYFSKKKRAISRTLEYMIKNEQKSGLNSQKAWEKFSKRCRNHKTKLISMIRAEMKAGLSVAGYGASARSSTLLNFCGINKKHLLGIADMNPLKHNKYTAGTDIPILPPEKVFLKKPDSILLLAWNFKDEVVYLLKNKYGFRGKVIVPLPGEPMIIDLKKKRQEYEVS